MNRYILSIVTAFFLFYSCKSENPETEIIVNKLLSYSFEMPPSHELSFIPLYIKQSDTVVYIATTYELWKLFEKNSYSEKNEFSDYLLKVFNRNTLPIEPSNSIDSFKINSKIYGEYVQNNFEFIIEKYTYKIDNEYILKSSNINFEEESTVSYIFFLNNYFSMFDDLYGETTYLTFRECLDMKPKENKE
ncbi:MAG: hypothetical protein JW870_21570 [Candidatus Delongbacteria bacterium]|nr:hypothetical protein [Candidatus Delongbacteria bacterium]